MGDTEREQHILSRVTALSNGIPRLFTIWMGLERGWKAVLLGLVLTVLAYLGLAIPW